MNSARTIRTQALRPRRLSHRHRCLRRYESSSSSTAPHSPPPPPPPLFHRHRRAAIWSTLAAIAGATAGTFALHLIAPPAMPLAGTREDNVLLADLHRRIDGEFKVQVLRGKCRGVAKVLRGEEAGWVEILLLPVVPVPVAFPSGVGSAAALGGGGGGGEGGGEEEVGEKEKMKEKKKEKKLPFDDGLLDQLQGAKGLGVQRIFWKHSEQKMVAIVWFGGALSGWPGVVHGGLIATALQEKMSLAAALAQETSAVSSEAVPQRLPASGGHAAAAAAAATTTTTMFAPTESSPDPVSFSVDYQKPTYANYFHVVRVAPAYGREIQGDGGDGVRYGIPGAEWTATLETLDSQICVRAAAKFSPRTTAERVEEKVADAAKWTYEEFKQRVWPSRQMESERERG